MQGFARLQNLASLAPLPSPFSWPGMRAVSSEMLTHAFWSTRDGPSSYATLLLTFLQTVLQKLEGLTSLERAISWMDLAACPFVLRVLCRFPFFDLAFNVAEAVWKLVFGYLHDASHDSLV